MRAQEKLEPAVTLFYNAAKQEGGSGFASVAFEGMGLTLFYKGSLSPSMQNAVIGASKFGSIKITNVPFSRLELQQAADNLEPQLSGTDYQSVDLNYETGTITVESMPAATRTKVNSRLEVKSVKAQSLRSATTVLSSVNIGVPVLITTATESLQSMYKITNRSQSMESDLTPLSTVPYGRNNDYAPYNAGGIIRNYDAPILNPGQYIQCTSGFAVHYGSSSSRILTAAHCGTPPDAFYDGGSHTSVDLIGTASAEDWDKDIMTLNNRGAALMFTGTAGSNTWTIVNSWGYWAAGEYLCQSGAAGGEECALMTGHSGIEHYQLIDSDGDTFTEPFRARVW